MRRIDIHENELVKSRGIHTGKIEVMNITTNPMDIFLSATDPPHESEKKSIFSLPQSGSDSVKTS